MPLSSREKAFHRKIAVRCFNGTWDYLEKKRRSTEDNKRMLQLAHTSRYHWSLVGTPRNNAVSDWQISRVYAALNQPELAIQFAKSCLHAFRKNGMTEILCTGYEAIARSYAVAKNYKLANRWLRKARAELEKSVTDEEDRGIFLSQIKDTMRLIPTRS